MKIIFIILLTFSLQIELFAQQTFTRNDSLRGMLSPSRSCYDVTFYHLKLNIDPGKQTITGSNIIRYQVVQDFDSMQIDLFLIFFIDSIMNGKQKLKYRRDGNAVFVKFNERQRLGRNDLVEIFYHGKPLPAKRAPWDGGFIWQRDVNGKPWIGTACQGTGASSWWPCKDHQSDEPDSMRMDFTAPSTLRCASNGRLTDTKDNSGGTTTWYWKVSYPINNYCVTLNLADYAYFSDSYIGINGDTLSLEYYVLQNNLSQAKEHFKQVKLMLACYEKRFGRYPFYRDGYKLIESSYWGMEHQSAIAYGNAYQNNAVGFDFIIIHESAHEWWGNLLTVADNADLWIQESFATYAEALYVECRYDYPAYLKYMHDIRWHIADKFPLIGPYNINYEPTDNDNDIYYKGAWIIHSFRSQLNNDSLFFSILKNVLNKFAYKTTNSNDLVAAIINQAGIQYQPFFDQYLRYTNPPTLLFSKQKKKGGTELKFQWQTDVKDFIMNVDVTVNGNTLTTLVSSNDMQTLFIPDVDPKKVEILNERYYFKTVNNK